MVDVTDFADGTILPANGGPSNGWTEVLAAVIERDDLSARTVRPCRSDLRMRRETLLHHTPIYSCWLNHSQL